MTNSHETQYFMNQQSNIFIISGTTGAGKNTVVKAFLEKTDLPFVKIITYTTRPPRRHELNGRDYHFVTEEEFVRLRASGVFLEWAKVHKDYYGTPKKDVIDALKQGNNVMLIVDVQGAKHIKKIMPSAILIFITLENFAEIKKRFIKRHGHITPDLAIRLQSAQNELKEAAHYDYTIVNYAGRLDETVRKFEKIIHQILGRGNSPN